MESKQKIQYLLQDKASLEASLRLLPYVGTPEVKQNQSGKYLYMRRRELGKLKSIYVNVYSDELYATLLRYSREARELKKSLRKVESELVKLGYTSNELSNQVERCLDFARANLKANVYDQAVLEGVATTYPQTETILENGIVNGVTPTDVQKILNLKHAWEFILDKDVLQVKCNFHVLCYIARLVNEGFYYDGGRVRSVPVKIGGSSYIPPLPIEAQIKDELESILNGALSPVDKAIELCLYVMKSQIFNDGNKRVAVIFASHYLISNGVGLLVIPEKDVPEFKQLLVAYYENVDSEGIKIFLRKKGVRYSKGR